MARTRLKIDIVTDVVCPWCLVGSVRLDKAVATLPETISVDIENHPFTLDPDTPPEGHVVGDMLRRKYGRDPAEMWARVEGEARRSGIDLDLSRQPRAYPTIKAHALARAARAKGTQHALANAIAEAYFLEYRLINEDEVLAEIAIRFGFDKEEARAVVRDPAQLAETAQLARGIAAQGIGGVPYFVFNGQFVLSGAQPEEVFEQALAQALEDRP